MPKSNGNYCDVLIEESHENIIFGDVLIMGAQIIAGFRLIYQQAINSYSNNYLIMLIKVPM